MRKRALLIGSILWLVACSDAATVSTQGNERAGGTSSGARGGTGGATTGSGGASGGATSGSGGTTGGATASGGAVSGGGTTASGGMTASGGTSGAPQGGSTGLGGTLTGGGPPGTGGAATGGSLSATGGMATGGTPPATGGMSTGGTPPVCTDSLGTLKPPYSFPQNFKSSYCIYPTSACSTNARTIYNQWKQELVTSDGAGGYQRVRRPENEFNVVDSTVSEGIGYGMILSVFMDDQTLFDNLWKYSQIHLNANGLMIWIIEATGEPAVEDSVTGRRASGSATDADEDMAWALAQAAQKWGGRGSLSDTYDNLGRALMGRIIACERDTRYDMLNAGDSWGTVFAWNPSYFAPNQYKLFAKLDTPNTSAWNAIIAKGYQVLAASQNSSTGLVPAWTDTSGAAVAPPDTGLPTHYQYDSTRVPFRIGQDYCDTGDSRAKAILAKLTTFFSGIGAANIVDGYNLDGSPRAENTSPTGVQAAAFLGPAGVGAMSTTNQAFVDSIYTRLLTQPDSLMLPKSHYYNLSWKTFTMLMMSGNLFDYTLHP